MLFLNNGKPRFVFLIMVNQDLFQNNVKPSLFPNNGKPFAKNNVSLIGGLIHHTE